ncbi:MAG: hypothetical protein R6U84_04860 [Candidatus Cloacimonadales bacterium]
MLDESSKQNLQEDISQENALNQTENTELAAYREVVQKAAKLANIDHDINNPLTIISLSISRITMAGKKHNDEKLIKYAKQMEKALANIHDILQQVDSLKNLPLIKQQRRIDNEKANTNS